MVGESGKQMIFIKLQDKGRKIFIGLTLLFIAYVLPIIWADRYYYDDLARAFMGEAGWNGDGRPLTELLMKVLCGGMPLVDISPLPLLLGISILAYVLALYAQKNMGENTHLLPQICALFFVIMNPFLLSNLSYKFDVLSMLMALSAVFLCYTLPEAWGKWRISLCSFLFCLMALSLYQAVIGAYLGLFLIHLVFRKRNGRIKMGEEILRLVSLAAAGLVYKVAIAEYFVSKNDWRAGASQYISEVSRESLVLIKSNIINLCIKVKNDISGLPFLPLVLVFLAIIVVIFWKVTGIWKKEGERKKKVFWSLYYLFLPTGIFFACLLPLIFLEILRINSRTLIALSVFTLFLGFVLLELYQKKKAIAVFIMVLCMLSSYVYAYAYGNALESQKNYETYLGMNIVRDVEKINCNNEYVKMTIDGETPRSQVVQRLCEKYPQFSEIVPVYITNDTWIGGVWLYYYMQHNLGYEEMQEEDYTVVQAGAPVEINSVYSCYVNGDKIIIHFNE